jgi:dephospho-CoA kinase
MYLIGLTGGIASGKSVVSGRLASRGAIVVDADVLAREVVEPGSEGLEAIARAFGPKILASDGSLDRAALGAVIFSDPEERAKLNALDRFARAHAEDPHAVVVYDVPLLVESSDSRPMRFDLIVVVHASSEVRLSRLMAGRGMTREEATHRLNSQASDAERLAIADVVIDSNGSLDETLHQADELWEMAAASAVSAQPE